MTSSASVLNLLFSYIILHYRLYQYISRCEWFQETVFIPPKNDCILTGGLPCPVFTIKLLDLKVACNCCINTILNILCVEFVKSYPSFSRHELLKCNKVYNELTWVLAWLGMNDWIFILKKTTKSLNIYMNIFSQLWFYTNVDPDMELLVPFYRISKSLGIWVTVYF